jgi:hypothetical protein
MPEPEVKTSAQLAAEIPDAESQAQDTGKKESATTEEKKPEASEEHKAEDTVVEMNLKFIKQTADGFEFKDPENPEGTTYKGATLDDLIENMSKGFREKDTFINKLKAKETIKPDAFRDRKPPKVDESDDEEKFPDAQAIVTQTAKDLGVDVEMLNWGKKEWRDYEVEEGALQALKANQQVERVRQEANARLANENATVINNINLREETQEVRDLLGDYNLTADEFKDKFDDVVGRVYKDEKNFSATGVRKTGVIVKEAAREMAKLYKAKLKADVEKEVANDKKKSDDKKTSVRVAGSGSRSPEKAKTEPKNLNDALERAKAEFLKLP